MINKVLQCKPNQNAIEIAKEMGIKIETVSAVMVNNKLKDIRDVIGESQCSLIYNDIDVLRHSMAHLLAQSVRRLFSNALIATGPTTETGFFYDFEGLPSLLPEDLEKIIHTMNQVIRENIIIEKEIVSKEKALEIFASNPLKKEIINEIEGIISIYKQKDFVDLCRGPHVFSTGVIKQDSFKIKNISQTQWKNRKLTRISCVGFENKKELLSFLENEKLILKNSHKSLGHQMDLFFFSDLSPGCVFWQPKGQLLRNKIIDYIRDVLSQYKEIRTPIIYKSELWKISGHYEKYKENMFVIPDDQNEWAMKPMSCPAHIEQFKHLNSSYAALPIRFSEFGHVHRKEPDGARQGLTRLLEFTQDDGHIFLREDQILDELKGFFFIIKKVYFDFGFDDFEIVFSTKPEKYIGEDLLWEKAENSMLDAIEGLGLKFTLKKGDGAFYGPKFDFYLKDGFQRKHQCGTIQLDFCLPRRFNISYINKEGKKIIPVMIHRAILGSIERFMAILLEHHRGILPFWLCPVHVAIIPINDNFIGSCSSLYDKLLEKGIFADIFKNQTTSAAIRNSILQKIPMIVIIGEKEQSSQSVSLRWKDKTFVLSVENFINLCQNMIDKKERYNFLDLFLEKK